MSTLLNTLYTAYKAGAITKDKIISWAAEESYIDNAKDLLSAWKIGLDDDYIFKLISDKVDNDVIDDEEIEEIEDIEDIGDITDLEEHTETCTFYPNDDRVTHPKIILRSNIQQDAPRTQRLRNSCIEEGFRRIDYDGSILMEVKLHRGNLLLCPVKAYKVEFRDSSLYFEYKRGYFTKFWENGILCPKFHLRPIKWAKDRI